MKCVSFLYKCLGLLVRIYTGVKGRDGSAEELDRETGEERTTVGRTHRKDGG